MSEVDPEAAEAAAAACPPEVPDDAVVEILARVPDLISLFRCSVVCKRWRSLMADPVFLRRLFPEGASSLDQPSLLGFFVQRRRIHTSPQMDVFPSRAPAFVPAPGCPLGPERRFLTSFVSNDAGLLDDAEPLVARGGLLLVRLAPRPSDERGVLRLCVFNLLSGWRELLPPLDASVLDGDGVQGYGLITAADHDAEPHWLVNVHSTLFQVLLIGVAREDGHLHLLKFSSADAESQGWNAYDCSHTGVPMQGPKGCRIAAIANGTAHWLFHGNDDPDQPSLYTLDVSVNTGHITTTMLPFAAFLRIFPIGQYKAWLCNIDGQLSLLNIENNMLIILAPVDTNGTLLWSPVQFALIRVEMGLFGESLFPLIGGEDCGTVLRLYDSDSESAYMLDVQPVLATKVASWTGSFNYMTAVPCEINWPMFFTARLVFQSQL